MLRCMLSGVVMMLLAIGFPVAASGDDSSWKMPNLNPFAGKSGSSSRSSSAPTSGWHMPKLWQTTKSPARPRSKAQPSTWNQMTTGTQQLFTKTADALTPWDNKKPAPPPKITGSNSIFTHNKPKSKKSDDVAPASWWSTEKNDAPKSVNEFLSRPRPN